MQKFKEDMSQLLHPLKCNSTAVALDDYAIL